MKNLYICAAALLCTAIGAMAADRSTMTVDDQSKTITEATDLAITLSGTAELHITGRNPMTNSTVDLRGDHAMLCLEGVMPADAGAYTPYITIDGAAYDPARARIARYGSGCAIIADVDAAPLTIYMEPAFGGKSMDCDIDVYYRADSGLGKSSWLTEKGIGDFDNHIGSFRLRHGYQATFANNPNGTGHSRVFMAKDGDLEITAMPQGLEFASFIRVCRIDWIGKKGTCSRSHADLARATWYYDWGGGSECSTNAEYVPMRHNAGWDSWKNIGTRTGVSCVLGFNEPDHSDQSNMSVFGAMEQWPEMFKNGLRIGSPAPDQISKDWLKQFMAMADSLNFRVDFVATHMYWNSQQAASLVENIENNCKRYYGGRPMWITEWNNGANWTGEAWPNQSGTKLDANFRPVLDKDGKEQQVTRPHTEANSKVQCDWLRSILPAFDASPYIERHSLYSWVEDARGIVLANTEGVDELTPAGRVFADFQSRPALRGSVEYEHKWKIAPPFIKSAKLSGGKVIIRFYDHNGETGTGYILERRIDRNQWERIATLEAGKDYNYGNYAHFEDIPQVDGKYRYRIKAKSYIGTESTNSRVHIINVTGASAGIVEAAATPTPDITTGAGYIRVEGMAPGSYPLHAIDGRAVCTVSVGDDGTGSAEGLAHGVYIFAGRKVVL